jgi:phosphomannomutase
MKHNIQVEPHRLYSLLQGFRVAVEHEQLSYDQTDGIKLSFKDGWVHVRASNTESMIRIIAEASNITRAQELLDWARDRLKT